ncbi:MAG: mechanosensitive ion channel family protein [Planctomycetota bacterium]|nr:MAG: mechanosensitive ion channel family protein [Planctomycetota bacterium]
MLTLLLQILQDGVPAAAETGAQAPDEPAGFLDRVYLGNTVTRWIVAAGVFLVVLLALLLIKSVIVSRIKKWAQHTQTQLDDLAVQLIEKTRGFFLVLMAAFVASHSLALPGDTRVIFQRVVTLGVLLQLGFWAGHVVGFAIHAMLNRRAGTDPSRKALAGVFGFLSRLVVWSLIVLLALDNLGVDVTAAVAGLGVGGIAVALALQNILGDLFASLTIILDKPFEIGDAIVIGDFTGTVEEIGLKSTRLRSTGGEQIIASNSDLLGSRIRNFKRMQERRIVFGIGVAYETPKEKLAAIPAIVKEVVSATPDCRYGRAHLKTFGESALQYEIMYMLDSPDYDRYMDAQERINTGILERFAAKGIEFAYPTRTVLVRGPV